MKEKAIKFLNFLFPFGNLRYYAMYVSSIIVLGVASWAFVIIILWITDGTTISTDTFVTHMDFLVSHRVGESVISIIANLSNIIVYLWLLVIHTGLSIVVDFIIRPVLWLIKRIISV
jgi:hypothetical protein